MRTSFKVKGQRSRSPGKLMPELLTQRGLCETVKQMSPRRGHTVSVSETQLIIIIIIIITVLLLKRIF